MSEIYNRTNPFLAKIKERVSLCKPGTQKETIHIVVDIKGSGLSYSVGDSLAILPSNDPVLVERIIQRLDTQNSIYTNPKTNEKWEIEKFLQTGANLGEFSRKFIEELLTRQKDAEKRTFLENLLHPDSNEKFKDYQQRNDILSVLELNPEVLFSVQEFCSLLKPMMPRFYSIASSQKAVGDEVHLTVALQKWSINERTCFGVCTHFLCDLMPLNLPVLPVYIHPSRGFTLPSDFNAPIIMVGPGTGVAPFRGFMQEREVMKASGKNWLFFGEWNRNHHYFYEEYFTSLQELGKMRLDLAFSRDQENKIYVQHRLLENGEELFQWLQNGAYLYVCGDASRMAKDVDEALHEVAKNHGNFSEEKAKEFIKTLRHEKRYLRDVY